MLNATPRNMDGQADKSGAIRVRILFFGPLAEKIGSREIPVSLIEGTSLQDLIDRFELSEMLSSGLRVAIDGEIQHSNDAILHDSAEIALLPPVSGG